MEDLELPHDLLALGPLNERFMKQRVLQDLNESIQVTEKALKILPGNRPYKAVALNELAILFVKDMDTKERKKICMRRLRHIGKL